MGDAAQGELLKHVVFEKPFKVVPKYENWKTPDSYFRFPDSAHLPEKMKVWRVQNQRSGKSSNGVVARSWGFNDSPDAEVLTPGYNDGKEHGAVGVGRHGNFLQWGFSAPPSQMTEAGRKFFLNCVCYIDKFDGKGPLIRRVQSDRIAPVRMALLMPRINGDKAFRSSFTPEQLKKYRKKPKELARYYRNSNELIYWDEVYKIDDEFKQLGIKSNRKVETLGKIITLLKDSGKAEMAQLLLKRYTVESFDTQDEWQSWFDSNRDRIYFSDVGGYKFRVIPEGYLVYQ